MLVIVPTRGRPDNARRLEREFRQTSTTGRADLVFVVDDDDPEVVEYIQALVADNEADRAHLAIIHRQRLGPTLNMLAAQHMDEYDVLGFMGDDHVPRTTGWDFHVLEAVKAAERPAVVYGNDLLQGPNLPTAVFMDARIVRATGHMVPPGMIHLYLDDYWKALGEGLGSLVYLPETIIEHLHPAAGKAPMDDRYAEVNAPAVNDADGGFFRQYVAEGGIESDVRKVADACSM